MIIKFKKRYKSFGFMLTMSLLFLLSGCRGNDGTRPLPERYLKLAIALGERDPDSLDFYDGPEDLQAEVKRRIPSLAQLADAARDLDRQIRESDLAGSRKRFFDGQLGATELRIRMLEGEVFPFDQESRALFGIVPPVDRAQEERSLLRAQIADLIGKGPTAYSRYEAKFQIPGERVPAVFALALAACREQTLAHIQMPMGEKVDVEYVFNKPWAAFSRYTGDAHSVIQVNLSYPQTLDRILELACHEGYPGHHVFNSLRDQHLARQEGEIEWTAQLTYSPQSFLSEAAASYAPYLALDDDARIRIEYERLLPASGISATRAEVERYVKVERLVDGLHTALPEIAREYLDGKLEFARALDRLQSELLMENGEAMLLYLNEYRTYMLTYTTGRDMVASYINAAPVSLRWNRYTALMTSPITTIPDR